MLVYELASVLLKSVKRGLLTPEDAADAAKAVGLLGLRLVSPSWVEAAEVIEIARSTDLTVYDSIYIWLSRRGRGRAEVVTLDELR